MIKIPEFPTEEPEVTYARNAILERVYDGDTFYLKSLDHGCKLFDEDVRVRLWQVNTPEVKGPEKIAGLYVKRAVQALIGDQTTVKIDSKRYLIDSFSRLVCLLWVDGVCINQWLLQNRLAWPTDTKGKLLVPRNVDDLNVPDEIKQAVREAQL